MSNYDSNESLHGLMVEKGFVMKTEEEIKSMKDEKMGVIASLLIGREEEKRQRRLGRTSRSREERLKKLNEDVDPCAHEDDL
mmetsp:Transcript_4191/g.5693  ORF Transcript_4191/g.5693 Transcript_4191/m.5693 type:complete len:82 (-) Transcript_4191:691-936(-)